MSEGKVPAIVTDEFLNMHQDELVSGLKYILTEPGTQYSFIVKQLDHMDKVVTEKMVKAGEDLDEAELNLLVGVMINEFKELGIEPSSDYDELRVHITEVLDRLESTTKNKPNE
jgi:hypothetical protein